MGPQLSGSFEPTIMCQLLEAQEQLWLSLCHQIIHSLEREQTSWTHKVITTDASRLGKRSETPMFGQIIGEILTEAEISKLELKK
jgi:hypothetical protein